MKGQTNEKNKYINERTNENNELNKWMVDVRKGEFMGE